MTTEGEPTILRIRSESDAAVARETAMELCLEQGFERAHAWELARAVSDLASGLARHGVAAVITMRTVHDGSRGGVEIAAIDRGRGLASSDGADHSTHPELGAGLEALRAQTDALYFADPGPDPGTRLVATRWNRAQDDGEHA